MALMPFGAHARACITALQIHPDLIPHTGKGKRRRRMDVATAAEVLDLFEELAACFAPVAETPEGTAFVCVLPPDVTDRLAIIGVELADHEEDAGDMPEQDDAETGLADPDALHLWMQDLHAWRGACASEQRDARDRRSSARQEKRFALLARLHQLDRARRARAAYLSQTETVEV